VGVLQRSFRQQHPKMALGGTETGVARKERFIQKKKQNKERLKQKKTKTKNNNKKKNTNSKQHKSKTTKPTPQAGDLLVFRVRLAPASILPRHTSAVRRGEDVGNKVPDEPPPRSFRPIGAPSRW
jgi:hypothetical protein